MKIIGMYDLHLEEPPAYFFPDDAPRALGDQAPVAPADPADVFALLRGALQKLGLRLDRAQGTEEFPVVDHVERPTEN